MAFPYITVTPNPIYSPDLSPPQNVATGERFLIGSLEHLDHYVTLLAVASVHPDGKSFCCYDGKSWAWEMKL